MDINKYVGLKYRLNGKDKTGFDCWGFFVYFNKHENNYEFLEQYHLDPEKDIKKILVAFSRGKNKGCWLRLDKPEQGCAVALGRINHIHHVGVWVNGGVLHCVKGLGVVYDTTYTLKRSGYNRMEYYKWKNPIK